jgi:sugar phosphate isomerase/epimerase
MSAFPFSFRIGTTSYIIPDDILPNVRYLANKVQDIELILFEVDDANNLPSSQQIDELNTLSSQYGLTYTVHLPLDLKLGKKGVDRDISIEKGLKVIACTHQLKPAAYVVHLDGKWLLPNPTKIEHNKWAKQAIAALEIIAKEAGSIEQISVENLEGYPLDFNEPVLDGLPVSCCVDIGHLWFDHHPALPFLSKWISRTRVIHLHGIGTRAHQSLRNSPPDKVKELINYLCDQQYRGILTLEIFGQDDFETSMDVVLQSVSNPI